MNYIFPTQLIVVISKKEVHSGMDQTFNLLIDDIINDLYKKEYSRLVYEESHQYTINILGEFSPYDKDKRKSHESIIKYSSTKDWVLGESSSIFKHNLSKYEKELSVSENSSINNYLLKVGYMFHEEV